MTVGPAPPVGEAILDDLGDVFLSELTMTGLSVIYKDRFVTNCNANYGLQPERVKCNKINTNRHIRELNALNTALHDKPWSA